DKQKQNQNGSELTKVLMGGSLGVPIMLGYYSLMLPRFTVWLAIDAQQAADPVYRLGLALRWLAPVCLTVVACIQAVATCRMFNPSIDGRTPHRMTDLWRSILQNTLEQAMVLTLNLLAMSQNLPSEKLAVVPMAVVLFIVARVIFAIGYIIWPTRRALGFSLTHLPNVAMTAYNVGCLLRF
ncbi:hypothetical protein BOX15_Mlig026664g1, partial [Macrostomum lignano]